MVLKTFIFVNLIFKAEEIFFKKYVFLDTASVPLPIAVGAGNSVTKRCDH